MLVLKGLTIAIAAFVSTDVPCWGSGFAFHAKARAKDAALLSRNLHAMRTDMDVAATNETERPTFLRASRSRSHFLFPPFRSLAPSSIHLSPP